MLGNAEVVAIFNTSPDIVEMLRLALEQAGFVVVTVLTHEVRKGEVNVGAFIAEHDPRVIVYDIAPPYDANWKLFLHTCALPAMRERAFVVTTTNAAHVEQLAGGSRRIYEIVGKPLDLEQIVRAVKEASRSRLSS